MYWKIEDVFLILLGIADGGSMSDHSKAFCEKAKYEYNLVRVIVSTNQGIIEKVHYSHQISLYLCLDPKSLVQS
jgi:hypothetical protein